MYSCSQGAVLPSLVLLGCCSLRKGPEAEESGLPFRGGRSGHAPAGCFLFPVDNVSGRTRLSFACMGGRHSLGPALRRGSWLSPCPGLCPRACATSATGHCNLARLLPSLPSNLPSPCLDRHPLRFAMRIWGNCGGTLGRGPAGGEPPLPTQLGCPLLQEAFRVPNPPADGPAVYLLDQARVGSLSGCGMCVR